MRAIFEGAIDPPRFHAFLARTRSAFRGTLPWCVPALLVAIVLRLFLLGCMPSAFIHNDTAAIVGTADTLAHRGAISIDGKKTFLTPLVYSIPAVLHIPILPFVAVVQHLLGLLSVLLAGSLARLWFAHWRLWILPLTLLVAIQPVMLWYEHTALAESWAVAGGLLVACAGSLFWKTPDRYSLAILFAALFFMAGARPEGRLFALFAVVLVARATWGKWRHFRLAVPAAAAWALFLFLITRTGQSGLLLFTSVLHLAPAHLYLSPGVAEAVRDLSGKARDEWRDEKDAPQLVRFRKALQARLIEFQTRRGIEKSQAESLTNKIAGRAGLETAARNPLPLPALALRKFIIAHREPPAPGFNSYASDGQFQVLFKDGQSSKALGYSHLLWHRALGDGATARKFLEEEYEPIPGNFLDRLQDAWMKVSLLPVLPWDLPGSAVDRVPVRGVPWLYLTALLGIVAMAVRERTLLGYHLMWGAFLVGLFLLIMVTANIRSRFRVLFEPFWLLYAFALLDTVGSFAKRLLLRFR